MEGNHYHGESLQQVSKMVMDSTAGRVLSEFRRNFAGSPSLFRSPGRINIIGEHLDYNGGPVLPATVDLHTWAAACPRDDGVLEILLCNVDRRLVIPLADVMPDRSGGVAEYLKGVVWAMQAAGLEPLGCSIVIGGDIPLGGGLSSSASLELLLASVLADRSGRQPGREQLAQICHRAESEFVGVQCGIMDQYAIALGRKGQAMMLDCRTGRYDFHPLPEGAHFLVVHSGVSHQLPQGGYNSRRDECRAALDALREAATDLACLAELPADRLERCRARLGDTLYRRCRHVVTETRRVAEAVQAMGRGDLDGLGALISASHDSLRDDYEVSCAQLDALVETALGCEGVLGSRMMGGGFGGCTISLVRDGWLDRAVEHIGREYGEQLGREPWMHVVGPSGPVSRMEPSNEP